MSEIDRNNADNVEAQPVVIVGSIEQMPPLTSSHYFGGMPAAPRRRYHPIIETEADEDDEDDLEFTHYTYRCDDVEGANEGASALVALLTDGWAIEEKIVAAPFVTVLFSRVAGDEE